MSSSVETPRAARSGAAGVLVREVAPGQSLKPFAQLSWTINAADPNWVPPLRMVLNALLNRKKHPFYQHADVAFFVAERGGELVGRIAAVVNHRHNEFHGDRIGFFGLFESVDDTEVSGALVEAAAAWLRGRGMDTIRGPFNLSTNDELHSPGVLIDGFDRPPLVMMGHNPSYYGRLMEAAGMAKAKDLLAYWLPTNQPTERMVAGVERLGKREGWRIRPVEMKRLKEEIAVIQEVYNSAWERNWGFVPMTEAEFEHMASEFKPVVDPDLVLIAETTAGEPIGFLLCLPDLNVVLKKMPNGRLFPFGIFHLLFGRKQIHVARLVTLGLKPGHQVSGIGAALCLRAFYAGQQKGYTQAEGSWILEDNLLMCQALEKLGFYIHRRYRVYERPL
jgi:GNAT superfamily N-acetyltransferase